MMTFLTRLITVLMVTLALCGSSIAQSRRTSSASSGEAQIRDRLTASTIGLAGGLLEGAPIRFATEIARVVNDGGAVHVLPIVTRGPTENVNDLLYLKGVDAAIINSESRSATGAGIDWLRDMISKSENFTVSVTVLPRLPVFSQCRQTLSMSGRSS